MATTRLFAPWQLGAGGSFNPEVAGVAPITAKGTDVDNTLVSAVQAAAIGAFGSMLATSPSTTGPTPVPVSGLPATSGQDGHVLQVAPGGSGVIWDDISSTFAPSASHGPFVAVCFNQPESGAADPTPIETGAQYESIRVLVSGDGKSFEDLNSNLLYLAPGLRDPSILKIGDTWFLAATNASVASTSAEFTHTFPIFSSTDLQNWTLVTTVDCSNLTGTTTPWAWGPRLFLDPATGDIYIHLFVFNGATGGLAWLKATDKTGLTTWTTPAMVSQPGTLLVDGGMILIGSTYHYWGKDNTGGFGHSTATSPAGPFTTVSTGHKFGMTTTIEGAHLIPVGPSKWRMYADADYTGTPSQGMSWTETTDPTLESGWSNLVPCKYRGQNNQGQIRHIHVLPLTDLDSIGSVLAAKSTSRAPVVTSASKMDVAGDITFTTQTLTAARSDGSLDLTIAAKVGDLVLVWPTSIWHAAAASANSGRMDVGTMVAGSVVNWISSAASAQVFTPALGVAQWSALQLGTSDLPQIGLPVPYVVQAGDVSNGTVTFRLFGSATGSSATAAVYAEAGLPLWFTAVNLSS